jgi:hypothetical protein
MAQNDYRATVEADWARQETRLGRTPEAPAALAAALERTEKLLADLAPALPDFAAKKRTLAELRLAAARAEALAPDARSQLYRKVRWLARTAALENPLVAGTPIVFMTRRRFVCQMLHEYLGYFYDYGDIAGGGVHVLEQPGISFAVRDLTGDRLGRGNFTTLALSYDARTVYFAFCPRAEKKPDYYSPGRRCFHIFSLGLDGGALAQLTDGPADDFDPCALPDGGLAFMSTRRGGFGRCHNPWEPLPAYTLHRMDRDGGGVRTLSFHETNEWHPSVLADGRIVYSRWDYVDRSAAHFHGLWASNPDGTNPVELFGNYTQRINACFQARAIPGSGALVFVAGAHHADVGGSLVVVDPDRATLDPESGETSLDAIERLTPEVCFPEAAGWPKSYFHAPWPLSEKYFLAGFSFDPLPGMGPDVKEDTQTGLYLLDRFGDLELLYRKPGISAMYPIPCAPRPAPPVIASACDPALGDEGELFLSDVRLSHFPLPAARPIRALRIFQVLPKSETHVANQPRLGYANAESARMLLGTVPVEADGSACFRVPARKPLYFQAVDADGRAVQGMRSVTYLQPGERRGCVGCHEKRHSTSSAPRALALGRAPSHIAPGPDGTHPWSYARLIQPILEARCVRCHDGTEGRPAPVLTGAPDKEFTRSYHALEPHARWYEWGERIPGFVTLPGRMPADESPLTKLLGDERHAPLLSDEERRAFYLWLDGNASFYGAYAHDARAAQQRGLAVPPPALQ